MHTIANQALTLNDILSAATQVDNPVFSITLEQEISLFKDPAFLFFYRNENLNSVVRFGNIELYFTDKAGVRKTEDAQKSERDNVVFYYRNPMDRMGQIATFGWRAVWNGNAYSNSFDLNLADSEVEAKAFEILDKLSKNVDEAYQSVNPDKKGEYTTTIDEIRTSLKQEHGVLSANDFQSFLNVLIDNKSLPGIIDLFLKRLSKA
jgi:hypothetical protein